jgi:hypothetical protein
MVPTYGTLTIRMTRTHEHDCIGAAEAAQILGLSLRRVNQLILRGQLPARKITRVWVVSRRDLRLVEHRRPPGRPRKRTSKGRIER